MIARTLLPALCLLALLGVAAGSGARADDGLTYLVHQPPQPSARPPLIVLLHGSGADERDMIGLWAQLPPSFVVVSPRAPFGDAAHGYRWYRDATGEADRAMSRKVVDLVVDNAIHRFDADLARVFVAGFSQGGVMVYEVALREPGRFRGAAVLSGSLFASERRALSAKTDRSHEAFFVGHGGTDDRIPLTAATAAREELTTLGVPTAFHAYPAMGHATGDAEVKDLSAWLTTRLAGEPAATSR